MSARHPGGRYPMVALPPVRGPSTEFIASVLGILLAFFIWAAVFLAS